MTLAPEHELVEKITTPEQKAVVDAYVKATAKRSERDRMADVKTISGAFTGGYAEHPFTKEPIPIWIGDYVLAGYGTGAVMSVPCGDQRDYDFAKHFKIDIPNIFEGVDISEEAFYWGEPFPVYYDEDGMPQMLEEKFLPLELPEVDKYLPTETGEPPLGNAKEWHWLQYGDEGKVVSEEEFNNSSPSGRLGGTLELNTMPLNFNNGLLLLYNRYLNDKKGFKNYMTEEGISDEEWAPHVEFLNSIENEIYNAKKKGMFIFDENSFQPIRVDLKYLQDL